MVQTISWMVKREDLEARKRTSRVVFRWFLAGGLAGGVVAGVVVAGAARLVFVIFGDQITLFSVAAAVVSLIYLGGAVGLWSVPKPQFTQQVPSSWRDVLPPRVASFLYAMVLGATFFTRVASVTLFPMVVLALGLGRWPVAVISLFALAGLIRAGTALIVPLSDWVDTSGIVIASALEAGARIARRLEVGVLAAIAAALIAVASLA